MELWKEFYDILKYDRSRIPFFLSQYGKYETLRSLLIKIEKNIEHDGNIIKDLFLGEIGYERNKQMALYELPTLELIEVIDIICKILEIKTIEEICGGIGLVSKMLKLNTNLEINCTDGMKWIQTNGEQKYTNVGEKLISNYVIENHNFENKMLLTAWLPHNGVNDFKKLIYYQKPKIMVIIGEIYQQDYDAIMDSLVSMNYNILNIPVKQICYRDYYYKNTLLPEECCRSSLILCVSQNIDKIINQKLIEDMGSRDLFCKIIKTYTDKLYLQDLIVEGKLPKFVTELLFNNDRKLCRFIKMVDIIYKKKYIIPKFINNYKDFKFWYQKVKYHKYPTKIETYEKFREYQQLCNMLTEEGINKMKSEYILSNWVRSTTTAEQFLWLEFSTTVKDWKESRRKFRRRLNHTLHSMENTQQIVTPRSIIGSILI